MGEKPPPSTTSSGDAIDVDDNDNDEAGAATGGGRQRSRASAMAMDPCTTNACSAVRPWGLARPPPLAIMMLMMLSIRNEEGEEEYDEGDASFIFGCSSVVPSALRCRRRGYVQRSNSSYGTVLLPLPPPPTLTSEPL